MSIDHAKNLTKLAKAIRMRGRTDQAETLLAAASELDRLAGIVAKLPVTRDGVPITPGMKVWVNGQGLNDVEEMRGEATVYTSACNHAWINVGPSDQEPYPLSAIYSTKSAALASEKGGGEMKCPCPLHCPYCGRSRSKDSVGHYCKTKNCQFQHGYKMCRVTRKTKQPKAVSR